MNDAATVDLVFKYCRWAEYAPKPIPKKVTDHREDGWQPAVWF